MIKFPKLKFDVNPKFIKDKLLLYKYDVELMKSDCKERRITDDPNQKFKDYLYSDKTNYEWDITLHDLLIYYKENHTARFIPGVIITDDLFDYKNHVDILIEKYDAMQAEQDR